MRLDELSAGYLAAAERLQRRLQALRRELHRCRDPQRRVMLRYQIAKLARIMTQCRDLAELTAHYYERSYFRNEKYTL
ncbi:MAG: hypothetical protein IJZ52_06245 [Clostridium sp.]|nr:hypothetical protein [Clostridium sp.]